MHKYIEAIAQPLPGGKHQLLLCRKTREFPAGFEGQSTRDLLGGSHSVALLKVRFKKVKLFSELRRALDEERGTTIIPVRDAETLNRIYLNVFAAV